MLKISQKPVTKEISTLFQMNLAKMMLILILETKYIIINTNFIKNHMKVIKEYLVVE